MTRAEGLLGAHAAEVEADLQRYCGVDLRDLWRPNGGASRLTYRRLLALIDHALPGESATKTAIRDAIPDEDLAEMAKRDRDGHGPWSQEALLLAAVYDVLRTFMWLYGAAKGGKSSQPPDPYPRPGVVSQRRRRLTPDGFAYLMRLRQQHAELHGYLDGEVTETN